MSVFFFLSRNQLKSNRRDVSVCRGSDPSLGLKAGRMAGCLRLSPLTLTGGLRTSGLVERLVSTMAAVTLSMSTSSSDRLQTKRRKPEKISTSGARLPNLRGLFTHSLIHSFYMNMHGQHKYTHRQVRCFALAFFAYVLMFDTGPEAAFPTTNNNTKQKQHHKDPTNKVQSPSLHMCCLAFSPLVSALASVMSLVCAGRWTQVNCVLLRRQVVQMMLWTWDPEACEPSYICVHVSLVWV